MRGPVGARCFLFLRWSGVLVWNGTEAEAEAVVDITFLLHSCQPRYSFVSGGN